MQKAILPTILFAVVLIFSIIVLIANRIENPLEDADGQIILFYGRGCPHCSNVDDYINNNRIESKLSFIWKEIYYNSNNAEELEQKAEICGLPLDLVGVPFLWDGSRCFMGEQAIIDFFQQKTNEG